MNQKNQLEIACFNLESALIAQKYGADRVELCDGFEVGGTTPSLEMTGNARTSLQIDLYVMVRPRGGNFTYTDEEFAEMKNTILKVRAEQVDGFVFGVLHQDNSINVRQNAELVALAHPLPCTFHRAFDAVPDAFLALEAVINCGFKTILTSGQMPNVVEGAERLAILVEKANNRIVIMPGGGLRASNVAFLQQKTKAHWYHSSAITQGNQTADAAEILSLKSNLNPY